MFVPPSPSSSGSSSGVSVPGCMVARAFSRSRSALRASLCASRVPTKVNCASFIRSRSSGLGSHFTFTCFIRLVWNSSAFGAALLTRETEKAPRSPSATLLPSRSCSRMQLLSCVTTAITSPLSYLLPWLVMCFAMAFRSITLLYCAMGKVLLPCSGSPGWLCLRTKE